MQPNQIRNLAQSSQWMDALRTHGTPEAFILAWISWEGLKNRILATGLAQRGWQIKDSAHALDQCKVHSKSDYVTAFTFTFGKPPHQLAGLGKTWTDIEKKRSMRDQIFHGSRTSSPEALLDASQLISDKVLNTAWMTDIAFQAEGSTYKLPNPYSRVNVKPAIRRSFESLLAPLQSCLDEAHAKRR